MQDRTRIELLLQRQRVGFHHNIKDSGSRKVGSPKNDVPGGRGEIIVIAIQCSIGEEGSGSFIGSFQ